jgi:pSer/pThr/pTyr-binding forkhead associated (FHA) protein
VKIRLDSVDPFWPELHMTFDRDLILIGGGGKVHLRIDDRWVSRLHCEIRRENGGLMVRDLRSRNGTLVNGKLVKFSALLPGDRLTIGVRTLRVSYRRCGRQTTIASKTKEVAHVGSEP